MKNLITSILLSFTVFSCQPIFKKIIGLKNVKTSSEKRISKFADKYGIPENSSFQIDEKLYWKEIKHLEKENIKLLNNLFQPMHIKGVKNDSIDFGMFSCNMPPKGVNIDWNGFYSFDFFPIDPTITQDTILDKYQWHVNNELNFIQDLNRKPIDLNQAQGFDLVLFAYWSIVGGRQSKNMIYELEKYKTKFPEKSIRVIYVNIDNLYIEAEK